MKLKVKQALMYSGIVYNPGEIVDIAETEVIETNSENEEMEENKSSKNSKSKK